MEVCMMPACIHRSVMSALRQKKKVTEGGIKGRCHGWPACFLRKYGACG